LEEVLDLFADPAGEVCDLVRATVDGVVQRDAEQLVVCSVLVLHMEDADWPGTDVAAGECCLGGQNERIEGVAIGGACPLDEAVVGRVTHGGEEPAIEGDSAELLAELVLVS
jgi:hypothetical protein